GAAGGYHEPVRNAAEGREHRQRPEQSGHTGSGAGHIVKKENSEEKIMIRALYSAASGMTAQQLNIDNIANNLANANTAGYKTRRAQFQDLLYQNLIQPGASAGQQTVVPTGLQIGLGTRAAS